METMENNTVSSTHQEKAKKMRKLRRWQIIVSLFGVAVIVWGVIEIVFSFWAISRRKPAMMRR